jgi:hypothetical protein
VFVPLCGQCRDEPDSFVVVVAVVDVLDDLESPWLAASAAPPPPNATAVAAATSAMLRFGRNICHLLSRRERPNGTAHG